MMDSSDVLAVGAGLVLAGAGAIAALAQQAASDGASMEVLGQVVNAETLQLGKELYAETCSSCHGANLEGQPDWKRRLDNGRMPAPPHDALGHTWHHSDQDLLVIVRDGLGAIVPGYESDMPAFGDTLTDEDIGAILAFIKSTWPEREREFQAQVTHDVTSEDSP